MFRTLLACFILALSAAVQAQTWTQRYNSAGAALDEACAVLPASNGGTIVVGSSYSAQSGWSVRVLAYAPDGTAAWPAPYVYDSPSSADDKAVCAAQDADGNIYVGGMSWSDATGWDMLVIKLLPDGRPVWSSHRNLEQNSFDIPAAIAVDSRGNVILTGSTAAPGAAPSIVTLSLDSSAGHRWTRKHTSAGTTPELARALAIDQQDNIVVAGQRDGTPRDILLLRYAADGTPRFSGTVKNSAGADDDFGAMVLDDAANALITGATSPPGRNADVFVEQVDPDGSVLWMRTWAGPGNGDDRGTAITRDPSGAMYVTAASASTGTGTDMVTLQYLSDGTSGWTASHDAGASGADRAAPRFAGATAAVVLDRSSACVTWAAANDDHTRSRDLVYDVYLSQTSGGQQFTTPDTTVTGVTSVVLGGLSSGSTWYAVVRARDAAGNADRNAREVAITLAAPLRITTASLPDGMVNADYSATLAASGGRAPYQWSLASGALPGGLQVQADGRITGRPAAAGSTTFRVRVTDADADTASATLTLTITAEPGFIVARDTTLPAGRYCYPSIEVRQGATLTFSGPAQLCATDSIVIHGAVRADCHALSILDFQLLRITGDVDNRCSGDSTLGGALIIFSADGTVEMDGRTASHGLRTHGPLTITDDTTFADWNFAIPPFARSAAPMDPVGSITADNNAMLPGQGDAATVTFTATGVDPDGGPVRFLIDYGDGTDSGPFSPSDEHSASIEKTYTQPGLRTVRLTITDDESRTAVVTMQVFIGDSSATGSDGFGLAVSAGDPIVAVGDTAWFFPERDLGSELDSTMWTFGDGGQSPEPFHRYAAPGRYDVRLRMTDDSSNAAEASMSVYVYAHDSTASVTGTSGASLRGNGAGTLALPPWRINNRIVVPRGGRIIRRGVDGMNVGPNGNIQAQNGANGGNGRNGQGGGTLKVWSNGAIVIAAGAQIRSANGGNGGANPNGPNGGNGGNGASLRITGRDIVINGGTFAAGDGGDGADQNRTVPASGTARANGGRGGNAGSSLGFHATRSITFNGPATIHVGNGGRGGTATATGGDGQDRCPVGQDAGNGVARGGRGGNAAKQGIIRGRVIINVPPTITGGQGGRGGDATANGGAGGDAIGCQTTARGGKGGFANALGGDGGNSGYRGPAFPGTLLFRPGDGGNGTANPGKGGDADAIPTPDPGADGCPGQKGGDTDARGGAAGRGYSINGAKGDRIGVALPAVSGSSTANGAPGGAATSRGGAGGNGIGCNCAGGEGGKAVSTGGLRSTLNAASKSGGVKTKNESSDGNATATGGPGGKGGDCCTPPGASGGPGGKGGTAQADAGPNGGIYTATGGTGGNGGDGKGPGPEGAGGTADGKINGVKTDGPAGAPGTWCFIIREWYIFIGLTSPGTISPGIRTLPVQRSQSTAPTEKVGEIDVEFRGILQQTPTGGVQMSPNSFIHFYPESFTGGDPNPPNGWPGWYPTRIQIDVKNLTTFANCLALRGFLGGDVLSETYNQNTGGIGSSETLSIDAPGGTSGDRFDMLGFITTVNIEVGVWIRIRWVDP